VDNDPCVSNVFWSTITAASPDSSFAGVLAGLLIAAVAALLVQWYQEGAGAQCRRVHDDRLP
jgi:hypothetical protein